MKRSVLAARRQRVIENIAAHAERLGAGTVDLVSGIKGDAEHKQLQMLERVDEFLCGVGNVPTAVSVESEDTAVLYSVEDILSIPGLTKTSIKAIEEAFNVSSD